MKALPISLAFLGLILPVMGQDEANKADTTPKDVSTPKWEVEIPERIADGTPSKPAEKPAPIDFKVINSRTEKVEVVKAPEMHDLPPVTGRIDVTVRMVEDPNLPDPPAPLPALEPNDPAVVARLAELREKYQGTSLVFMSASVYDHKRTLIRIHPNGDVGKEVSAWSNLDLNYFSGFSIYRVKDAVDGTLYDYGFVMGIGNEDTINHSKLNFQRDFEYTPPEIPKLPDVEEGGPAFVVIEGDSGSPAMAIMEQIHDLYRKEGPRMEAAYHARVKARAERKAYLLANPSKPDDVTISFWKRNPRGTASPANPSVKKSR